MGRAAKILERVLRGTSDSNLAFGDVCLLLEALGFRSRMRGDHHIYFRDEVDEIINLQPLQGHAKSYQVAQVRAIILKYRLGGAL
jgi:predicted RNA binding protein YcfA (HicA-like mRNA interferase family)